MRRFRRMVLDDPVNRSLGRVVEYDAFDWGRFEQIGPLLRIGPDTPAAAPARLPGIGEHTVEVLGELGFTDDEVGALLLAGVVRQVGR